MAEDRRQGDRRQTDRRRPLEQKTITISLISFVIFVSLIAITFVTAACFLAVFYERKINEMQNNFYTQELIYPSDDMVYIDVENIVDDSNVSTELITDSNLIVE